MYKKDLVKKAAEKLRKENARKPVTIPRQVFHISDDSGATKDFFVKSENKRMFYTTDDVEKIIDAVVDVIQDATKEGESVSIRGFGTFSVVYRKPRLTRMVNSEDSLIVEGRYVSKFDPGDIMRRNARLYGCKVDDEAQLARNNNSESEDDEENVDIEQGTDQDDQGNQDIQDNEEEFDPWKDGE